MQGLERQPGGVAEELDLHVGAGADRKRAGYWGVLIGRRTNARDPSTPRTECLRDCVQRCHADSDPMSDGTEGCLLGCTPRLDDC